MLFGLNKIVGVRGQERSGSKPEDVLFDRQFVVYWIREFAIKPLGCKSLQQLAELLPELNNDEAN